MHMCQFCLIGLRRETKKKIVLQLEGQFSTGLTRIVTASTIQSPRTVLLAQQPKHHTNFKFFFFFFLCSCSSYLVCGTMHGWTGSQQLATILTDADDSFTHQAVDPGCQDKFVFGESSPPLPVELGCWAFYCQLESLFHGCQLPRVARQQASCPSASWPSARSILVSSRHEQKALRHGSDSALTAEMFWWSFGGLSVLKLILFQ